MKKILAILLALCLLFLAACAAPAENNNADSPNPPATDPVTPDPVDPAPVDPVDPAPVDPVDPDPVPPAPTDDPTKPSVGKVQFEAGSGQESFNTVKGVGMGFIIRVRALPKDFNDEITLNIVSSDPSVVTIQRCDKLNNMLAEDGRMYVYDAYIDAHAVGTVTLTAFVPELNISSTYKVKVDPHPDEASTPDSVTPSTESNENLVFSGVPSTTEAYKLINYDILWKNLPADTDTNVTLTITSSDESVLGTGGWQIIDYREEAGGGTLVFHSQAMPFKTGTATLTVRINEVDISVSQTVEVR